MVPDCTFFLYKTQHLTKLDANGLQLTLSYAGSFFISLVSIITVGVYPVPTSQGILVIICTIKKVFERQHKKRWVVGHHHCHVFYPQI